MQSPLGNVEQPSVAKTQSQSEGVAGDKAKIVGFSHIVLCLRSEELEINLLVNESH